MERQLEKKKVLYVITKSNWGGAQRYVYDLAVHMRKAGNDVVVAAGGNGPLLKKLVEEHIRTISIPYLERDIHILKEFLVFFALLHIVSREKPDILHVNSTKIGGLGTFVGRILSVKKIIFTAHGLASNDPRLSSLSHLIFRSFEWLTILFSHKTIAVSNQLSDHIKSSPFTYKKVVCIHNGIHAVDFLSRKEAREKLSKSHAKLAQSSGEDEIWIGTVAELHPVKGLPYSIEAIGKLTYEIPSIRYLILGSGQEYQRLEKLIDAKGLRDHVFLLDFVVEASKYGKAYDVFLLPSLSEALALAILEAGHAGLPVVASKVGGIPEIIEDGKTGILVEPKDTSGIASVLKSLLRDRKMREKLGNALKNKVEKEFQLEQMVEKTVALYSLEQ